MRMSVAVALMSCHDFDNEGEDETNDTNVDEEDDDNAQDDVSTCRKLSPRCEDGCST